MLWILKIERRVNDAHFLEILEWLLLEHMDLGSVLFTLDFYVCLWNLEFFFFRIDQRR